MSMRNYAEWGNGFIVRQKDLEEFKSFYNGEDKEEVADCTDFMELADYINIDYVYITENGEIRGIGNAEDSYLDDEEDIGVYYLKKDNLFDKYENVDEIIDEVIEFYKGYDMEIPREFVEKRLGTFCGVSFG